MDLREHSVFFRASTFEDLLNDARLQHVIDTLAELTGEPWTHSQDLGARRRQRPLAPVNDLSLLGAVFGQGIHLGARFKLFAGDPTTLPHTTALECVAGGHPYTGRFRTTLDVRIAHQRFRDPTFTSAFVNWVHQLTPHVSPVVAHAHDTDDHNIQNIDNPNLLRSGFGLDEVPDTIDIRDNPGWEVNRGELRYAVNWLTLYGGEALDELGGAAHLLAAPAPKVTPFDNQVLIQLYDHPLGADHSDKRAVQRAVRQHLSFDDVVQDKSYALGFWDRKSRS